VQVYAVNLHLWHTPEAAVAIVAAKVEELRARGAREVDLVGHSMGGLVARQYLQEHGTDSIRRCILLGVPNQGSRLASFALSPTGKLLLPGSAYLQQLNAAPLPKDIRCTSIFSRHDNLVIPWESGQLDGARNCELAGVGHTALLYHPAAIDILIKELAKETDENT
jgi:predicted alpha/beta hydrolase family esterase